MSFDLAFMNLYRTRLVRRELALLTLYRIQGRTPRIAKIAYWRASFMPLALALTFFGARYLGLLEGQAAIVALCLLMGVVLSDMQLFVMNAGTWIFAKRALNWANVRDLSQAYVGPTPDLSTAGAQNRWDQVKVTPAYLKSVATTYEKLKTDPPSPQQIFSQSGEARGLVIMTILAAAFATLDTDFRGVILSIYVFFAAWPAKRLKAAMDFHVTWPVLRQAFDWSQIKAMAGKL